MGSWDACCGISKLPIRVGDPVVDFFLGEVVRFSDRGFICYPNDLWTPLTIQTYGDYDDYGNIAADTGWQTDYVTHVLREYLVELEQGENEYHDIAVKRDQMDYDYAQNAIHEGRLFVAKPNWVKPSSPDVIGMPVSRMMVHRFVFDAMVDWGIEDWRHAIDLSGLVEQGMELVAEMRQRKAEIEAITDDTIRSSMLILDGVATPRHGDNLFENSFRSSESGDLYAPHKFGSYYGFLRDNIDSPDVESIVTELAKFIIFRARMMELQFLWTPQTGSQNHAYETLSKLYRLCDEYAQDRIMEDAAEDDADDEE
jgi:hypothetical protein